MVYNLVGMTNFALNNKMEYEQRKYQVAHP